MTCRQHRDLPPAHNPEAPLEGLHDHWQEQPAPRLKWWWWLIVVALCALAFWLVARGVDRAFAHMHDRPDLTQWLMSLSSKHRGPCCDSAEAETMADPDWRNASEMKKGECGGSASDAVYCVRLENPDVPGEWKWWAVPDDAVVESPNKAGPALIWLIWNNRGSADVQPYIRCFLAGTLS